MDIKAKMESQKYSVHVQCPACLQETLYPEGDVVVCAFCNFKSNGESAAHMWADEYLPQSMEDDLIEPVVRCCPECGTDACIPFGRISESPYSHVCLTCAEPGDYQDCSRCVNCVRLTVLAICVKGCKESIIGSWD